MMVKGWVAWKMGQKMRKIHTSYSNFLIRQKNSLRLQRTLKLMLKIVWQIYNKQMYCSFIGTRKYWGGSWFKTLTWWNSCSFRGSRKARNWAQSIPVCHFSTPQVVYWVCKARSHPYSNWQVWKGLVDENLPKGIRKLNALRLSTAMVLYLWYYLLLGHHNLFH